MPPGAAFGDPLCEAVEGLRSLVRKERVVGPARGPTKSSAEDSFYEENCGTDEGYKKVINRMRV